MVGFKFHGRIHRRDGVRGNVRGTLRDYLLLGLS